MNKITRCALVAAVLAVIAGLPAWAQSTGGALQGTVTDSAGNPIIGALIRVTGPHLQGFQGTATDTAGRYAVPFLPAGKDYSVKVSAPGYGTVVRNNITIPLGATVSLPVALATGETEVTVTAAAPTIDLRSTLQGATLSDRMIEAIPLQRDSNTIAFLAPTAVNSGTSTPGMASIGGSTGAENRYIVNGMDVTNTDLGTSSGATMGNTTNNGNGTMLNFDFIQDMQVMTGGLPPEYDAMGGVVNAITRSGGNEMHGSLYAYYWSDKMQAKSKTYSYAPTIQGNDGYTRWDVGGDLGGYFIKNKLWYYVGYDYNRYKEYTLVPGGPAYGDAYLYLNGRPAQSIYTGQRLTDTNEINQQYAFKLTWAITSNQRLALTTFGNVDKEGLLGSLATRSYTSAPFSMKTEPNNLSLQWNATWSPKFFTEAVVSYHHSTQSWAFNTTGANNWQYSYLFSQGVYGGFQALPENQGAGPVSISGTRIDLGANYRPSYGVGGYTPITKDTSTQARVKFTHLLNHHVLSYGLQYDKRDYTPVFGLSGPTNFVSPKTHQQAIGGLFVQWAPASLLGFPDGPGGQKYVYMAQDYFSSMARPAGMTSDAAWINDDWNLTNYFVLKLGLRYSDEKVEGKLPGAESIKFTGNLAPRLGFSWDITHDGKTKVFGFAGRYFERIPADMAVRSLNNEQSGFEYFYDPQLTAWTGVSQIIGSSQELIQGQSPGLPVNSKLKSPYTDEYILGVERQVMPDFKIGARLIYRDLGRTVEDFSFNGAQTYIIGNPDMWTNIPVPGLNPDFSPNYKQTYYFPKPTRIYRALEITAEKRFNHHWQMGGSYVLSRLEGNYEGASSNDTTTGQLDPNINAIFDLPQFLVHGYGLLPLDRTHVLKVYGSYDFPNIPLELSANFALQTGTPLSKQIQLAWYGGGAGFADTRGTAGRTPTTWTLDLGAQYNFKLPKGVLGVRLDVFNVTNEQKATNEYQTWQVQTAAGGPLLMDNLNFKKPYLHQVPRLIRVGLRWTF